MYNIALYCGKTISLLLSEWDTHLYGHTVCIIVNVGPEDMTSADGNLLGRDRVQLVRPAAICRTILANQIDFTNCTHVANKNRT